MDIERQREEYKDQKIMVSVICPTYNHAPYIKKALDSILSQNVDFPYEILVGNDCSPDNSREILSDYEKKYPSLIKVYNRERNIGPTKNGYDLYSRARGKYLITLELDDYWIDNDKLKKQVDFLENNQQFMGCAHDSVVVDEYGKITKPSFIQGIKGVCTLSDYIEEKMTFQISSLLFRNFFLDGNDYTIQYKSHHVIGDLTIYSILLKRGDIYVSSEVMSAYRLVVKKMGTSATSGFHRNYPKYLFELMKQLNMLNQFFEGAIDYTPRMIGILEGYTVGVLKRETGFSFREYLEIIKMASFKAIVITGKFVFAYPVRKIRKALPFKN